MSACAGTAGLVALAEPVAPAGRVALVVAGGSGAACFAGRSVRGGSEALSVMAAGVVLNTDGGAPRMRHFEKVVRASQQCNIISLMLGLLRVVILPDIGALPTLRFSRDSSAYLLKCACLQYVYDLRAAGRNVLCVSSKHKSPCVTATSVPASAAPSLVAAALDDQPSAVGHVPLPGTR